MYGVGFSCGEAAGSDDVGEGLHGEIGDVGGGSAVSPERRGDGVDAFVGALSGEDDGDEQLKRCVIMEFRFSYRHNLLKSLDYCLISVSHLHRECRLRC